jgi:predicted small integral membrane protein
MPIRICKILVVANSCFFLLLVVFNNATDYPSNYHFIEHVLSMDTTFPGNSGRWRAITSPAAYRAFYAGIIAWESVAAALIGAGVWRLWRARAAPAPEWKRAKTLAAVGLTVSLTQWYLAFISVGGEWFLMWQSKTWNGQEAAARMFAMMGISLIFLCLGDDEYLRAPS